MTPAQGNMVVVRKRIAATREELFDEWTDPEGMREWMRPGDALSAEVQLEPRAGGALLFIIRSPTETFEHRGVFQVFERPSKLAFTWTAKNIGAQETLVTVEFREISATETELVLTHERIPRKDVSDRYQSGWSRIVSLLDDYLRRNRT
jgi:uncharacterized protein YndB with AHSA1/START domain